MIIALVLLGWLALSVMVGLLAGKIMAFGLGEE